MLSELFGCVKLFLIITACSTCRCLQVSIPELEYEVARGSDIVLPCSFTPARPNYEMFVLKWQIVRDNKGVVVATFYSNLNRINISPAYEGRATLNIDPAKLQSQLHLTKVIPEDQGNYQCHVLIPEDDEGTTTASTFLLVLVPPSPPICTIQGKAEYWNDITLTCASKEGSPTPLYNWKSYSIENIPRAFPPKTTEKDGVLSLFNISKETSGFFVCTSTNRIGSASCNYTLAVMPGSIISGATAGIIGGVVAAAALVLLATLIFCCCRKKKMKRAKHAEGASVEMAFSDRDDPEADDGYGEDKIQDDQKNNINEQSRSSNKTGITQLDEDLESHADSHKYRGSRDRLDDRDHYRGSSDRLDARDHYRGSSDRLDARDHYRGSSDRLDARDDYRGSSDRLDARDHYRGSSDRLDARDHYRGSSDRPDARDHYRGSRDRLDARDHYRGSRDRLDDRDHYRGSRDRLDDHRNHYHGSRDRLDDHRDHYRGSRDRLDDYHDSHGYPSD